ncbi:hypothetical protein PHISCL_09892, partial [Aspergillus sclerotialis]
MPPTAPKTGITPLDSGGQTPDEDNPQGAPMGSPKGDAPLGPLGTGIAAPPSQGFTPGLMGDVRE